MVSEEIFEIVDDGQKDNGRTPDHGHPISSPCEANSSGELKTWFSHRVAHSVKTELDTIDFILNSRMDHRNRFSEQVKIARTL